MKYFALSMNESARPIGDKSSNWRPERLMKIFLAGMNQRGSDRNSPVMLTMAWLSALE